jgi:hypothetical protein
MGLSISAAIRAKLTNRHKVTEDEIIEAFANREKGFLIDAREDHKTNPPTEWFVAETNRGRRLKICFVRDGKTIHIKTAYDATAEIYAIYSRHA